MNIGRNIDTQTEFWAYLQKLVDETEVVVDRPRGSIHPKYPEFVYPLDYGYLDKTMSADRGGIDCWIGTMNTGLVTGLVAIVDLIKRDSEIKVLIGCTSEENSTIFEMHQCGLMKGILVERPEDAY